MLDPNGIDRIGGLGGTAGTTPVRPAAPAKGPAFGDVLAGKLAGKAETAQGVKFSGHALQRIERRGISLDASTTARLNEGVSRAASKGARDSLVLVDDTAFVVSVPNRTVITAVDREHMKEQVFTNIDSAVIA